MPFCLFTVVFGAAPKKDRVRLGFNYQEVIEQVLRDYT